LIKPGIRPFEHIFLLFYTLANAYGRKCNGCDLLSPICLYHHYFSYKSTLGNGTVCQVPAKTVIANSNEKINTKHKKTKQSMNLNNGKNRRRSMMDSWSLINSTTADATGLIWQSTFTNIHNVTQIKC